MTFVTTWFNSSAGAVFEREGRLHSAWEVGLKQKPKCIFSSRQRDKSFSFIFPYSLPQRMCIDNIKTPRKKKIGRFQAGLAWGSTTWYSCINICSVLLCLTWCKRQWFTVSMKYILFPNGWLFCIYLFSLLKSFPYYWLMASVFAYILLQSWNEMSGIWIRPLGEALVSISFRNHL